MSTETAVVTVASPGTADVEERLNTIVGQLNAVHAELVDLVAEVDATGAWAGAGVRSLEHWLTWKAGVSRGTAVELVRLARSRSTHPALSELFTAGALSLEQAAAAVQAPSHSDREMAELAPLSTVRQIRTEVRCAQTTLPPDDPVTPRAEPGDVERVVMRRLAGGRWSLEADLDADHGAVLRSALDAARDRLLRGGRGRVTGVDALVDMASVSLDAEPAHGDRFRVNVYLDPAADVRSQWADGSRVPQWLVELLTCDGRVSPVFTDGARPVSVGRTQRTVPERTRRVVIHRDRARCRVPWCEHAQWLQVHHLDEWTRDAGPTDTWNLVTCCGWCHRAVHRGEFSISGDADDPDGLVFRAADGSVIHPGARPVPPSGAPPTPARPYEHPLGERLDTASLFFSHPSRRWDPMRSPSARSPSPSPSPLPLPNPPPAAGPVSDVLSPLEGERPPDPDPDTNADSDARADPEAGAPPGARHAPGSGRSPPGHGVPTDQPDAASG